MELKRAAELSICALLREALPDLIFYPSRGGGEDITPVWQPNHQYLRGDIVRPTNDSLLHALSAIRTGSSGATEPSWDDIPGSFFAVPNGTEFMTLGDLSVKTVTKVDSPLPPFGVVSIEEAEKTMATEDTNMMHGAVVWVTMADNINIVSHSQTFKRIYDALGKIGRGYDVMRRIMIHGIDISGTSEFSDADRRAHGDTIEFSMGASELIGQS